MRVVVSPVDSAIPRLLKLIKQSCELDLTTHGHAFPQKFAFVECCKTNVNGVCATSGQNMITCTKCGGTGQPPIHKSGADVVQIRKPDVANDENYLKLSDYIHYEYPPIEGLKFNLEYVKELEAQIYMDIFNASTSVIDSTAKSGN